MWNIFSRIMLHRNPSDPQVTQSQKAPALDHRELWHSGVLPALDRPFGRIEISHGTEEPLRYGSSRSLSSAVRCERLLHGAVRAHNNAASYVQRGCQPRGWLLAVLVVDFVIPRLLLGCFVATRYLSSPANVAWNAWALVLSDLSNYFMFNSARVS